MLFRHLVFKLCNQCFAQYKMPLSSAMTCITYLFQAFPRKHRWSLILYFFPEKQIELDKHVCFEHKKHISNKKLFLKNNKSFQKLFLITTFIDKNQIYSFSMHPSIFLTGKHLQISVEEKRVKKNHMINIFIYE